MKSQYLVVFVGLFALALTPTTVVHAGPQQSVDDVKIRAPHAMGTHLKTSGIPNFGQVTPNLYRGAQPNAEGIAALKKMGVDLVVDLRGGRSAQEEVAVTKLGMQYVSIPSHCPFPKDEPWAKFLKVVEQNPGKKIFVHCRLGDDRTGMAVASYRIAEEGWSADEALKEMKAFGFSAVHHAMCPGLEEYEEMFPERVKKNPAFRELPSRSLESAQ